MNLRYRTNTELVLKGLNFEVEAGQQIGIVGRTGAGKSTVSMALSRLVEAESGKILIDGVDIARVDLKRLREKITIIPQDPCLFAGTLRYNIDPFGQHSDEVVERLAHRAGLSDVLARKQTAEMIESRTMTRRRPRKMRKTVARQRTGHGSDNLSSLSLEAGESLEKGGIYFWLTENGNNLSVGER